MHIEVPFVLDVDEDGWPPVSVEHLFCTKFDSHYRVESLPLFVKGLSVGDVISVECDDLGNVIGWRLIERSRRSTIWIAALGATDVSPVLAELRKLGCNTESLSQLNYHGVDVPEAVAMDKIDRVLDQLDANKVEVAFSAERHSAI